MDCVDVLKAHQISEKFGFMLENPVTKLDDTKYHQWNNLCELITNGTNFETVSKILEDIEEFDVNALTTHEVPERLPTSLARPLLQICELLEMRPVISHATIILANVKFAKGKEDPDFIAENLEVIMPRPYFKDADTKAYNWFFQVTAEIEAVFAPAIRSIASVCFGVNAEDTSVDLDKALTDIIDACQKAKLAFKKYRTHISPLVFFNEVRPVMWGYDGLPNGLKFGESEEPVKYRGASASESTAMQVVDAMSRTTTQRGFILHNRAFMPAGHRTFIEYVEKAVRKDDVDLGRRFKDNTLFPAAMKALRELRSEHVNVVTLFVITQMPKKSSNQAPSRGKFLMDLIKSFRDACIVPEH